MIRSSILLNLSFAILVSIGSTGCGKSSSSDAGSSGGSASGNMTGTGKEAADVVMTEIKAHWVAGPEGWITARTTGSAYAPDHYVRQLREITVVDVQPDQLSDSDKLNGVDWIGSVIFKQSSCREAGDPGMALEGISNHVVSRQRGQWSEWVDWQPDPVRLQRIKGQWQIDKDTWLLRGTLPAGQDFANAGVK
jgi:hypothetical protein